MRKSRCLLLIRVPTISIILWAFLFNTIVSPFEMRRYEGPDLLRPLPKEERQEEMLVILSGLRAGAGLRSPVEKIKALRANFSKWDKALRDNIADLDSRKGFGGATFEQTIFAKNIPDPEKDPRLKLLLEYGRQPAHDEEAVASEYFDTMVLLASFILLNKVAAQIAYVEKIPVVAEKFGQLKKFLNLWAESLIAVNDLLDLPANKLTLSQACSQIDQFVQEGNAGLPAFTKNRINDIAQVATTALTEIRTRESASQHLSPDQDARIRTAVAKELSQKFASKAFKSSDVYEVMEAVLKGVNKKAYSLIKALDAVLGLFVKKLDEPEAATITGEEIGKLLRENEISLEQRERDLLLVIATPTRLKGDDLKLLLGRALPPDSRFEPEKHRWDPKFPHAQIVGIQDPSALYCMNPKTGQWEKVNARRGAGVSNVGVLPHRGQDSMNGEIVNRLSEIFRDAERRAEFMKEHNLTEEEVAAFEGFLDDRDQAPGQDVNEWVALPLKKLAILPQQVQLPMVKFDPETGGCYIEYAHRGKSRKLWVVGLQVNGLGAVSVSETERHPFTAHLGFTAETQAPTPGGQTEGIIWVALGTKETPKSIEDIELDIMHEIEHDKINLEKIIESGWGRDGMERLASERDQQRGQQDVIRAFILFTKMHADAWERVMKACSEEARLARGSKEVRKEAKYSRMAAAARARYDIARTYFGQQPPQTFFKLYPGWGFGVAADGPAAYIGEPIGHIRASCPIGKKVIVARGSKGVTIRLEKIARGKNVEITIEMPPGVTIGPLGGAWVMPHGDEPAASASAVIRRKLFMPPGSSFNLNIDGLGCVVEVPRKWHGFLLSDSINFFISAPKKSIQVLFTPKLIEQYQAAVLLSAAI